MLGNQRWPISDRHATAPTSSARSSSPAAGLGRVNPNPVVGAVIARDGAVLGEGWHDEYGGPHAEVNAIACVRRRRPDGGDAVRLAGALLPPRPDAAVHRRDPRGRHRAASWWPRDDPTEKASGRGLGILRDEGVEIVVADGELAAGARLLNQAFRKHARTGRPWVLFKSAMTLDGKVATRVGDSKWISGEASREHAHHWRASVDAVVVGIGTALADDPQLTARVEDVHHQPRRVVFDSLARLPLTSQLVCRGGRDAADVVVSRAPRRAPRPTRWRRPGAQVIVATGENEPARVRSALDQLGAMGVASVLLEGGPHLAGAFLDAGEIDEVRLFLAPMLLGGRTARDPLEGEGVERIAEAMQRADARLRAVRRGPADLGAAAGVVSMFTGLVADLGRVAALERDADGAALAIATRAGRRAARGRLGGRQRRVPDGDRDRRRRLRAAGDARDARALLAGPAGAGRRGQPGARAAGRRAPGRPHRAGPRRRHGHAWPAFATRASRACWPSTPRRPCLRYVVEKGSIAVDGVSLTVSALRRGRRSRSR